MTVFVLLTASAWTGIIASYCLFRTDRFALLLFASILVGSSLLVRISQILLVFTILAHVLTLFGSGLTYFYTACSYEQKDPLLIYKLESVTLFDAMVNKINNQTVSILMRGQIPVQEAPDEQAARRVEVRQAAPEQRQDMSKYRENKQDLSDPNQQAAASQDTREQQRREPIRAEKTVGRNDPCPCGSGKKYKNCHGKNV